MTGIEGIGLWVGVFGYVLAVVALLADVFFDKAWLRKTGAGLATTGFAAHTLAIVVRWAATGHAPVMGAYENSLTGAWFVVAIAAGFFLKYRAALRAFPAVLAATVLLLGNGIMAPATLAPLEPPYRSVWLGVHVVFAWFAFGAYVVASGLAAYHLILTRKQAPASGDRAPLVDEVGARLIAFGFVGHAVMLASGAIWAHGLWGRYWGWDPVETWSLVSWLVYGVYLHLRFTLGWKGRRASWLAVGAVSTIIITFFGIGAVSDVHTEML